VNISSDQLARVRLMAQDDAFANADDRAAVVALLAERDAVFAILREYFDAGDVVDAAAMLPIPESLRVIRDGRNKEADARMQLRALLAPAESEASDGS
jgi:hypothetical protein